MSTTPDRINNKISWYENHVNLWAPIAAQIGLDPADVATLLQRTQAARTAFVAAGAARDASRAATADQTNAVASMDEFGGDLIKTIRAFAETTANPGVYADAQIPEPTTPAPLGPPDTPTDLTGSVTNAGHIALAWKGSRIGGTTFSIERRTQNPGEAFGAWTLLAATPKKKFTDENVPIGLESAQYRITAVRTGGASDPTEPVAILFGSSGTQSSGGSGTLGLAA